MKQSLFIVMAMLMGIACGKREDRAIDPQNLAPSAPDNAALSGELPDGQRSLIARYEQALVAMGKKSPIAASYAEYFRTRGVLAQALPNGDIMLQSGARFDPTKQFLVVADDQPVTAVAGEFVVGAQFMCAPSGLGTLFLRNFNMSQEVMAVLMSHEMRHAKAMLDEHEPCSEVGPGDPVWLGGELDAYRVGSSALEQMTGGEWGKAVEESRQERLAMAQAQGRSKYSFISGVLPDDPARVKRVFPLANDGDISFLLPQMEIDANLATAHTLAVDFHRTPEQDREAAITYMGIHYRR